ncbi:hypothetical protein [Bacillus phage Nachito]|nr:hypothetical protein [Bacillus phage Nachito]
MTLRSDFRHETQTKYGHYCNKVRQLGYEPVSYPSFSKLFEEKNLKEIINLHLTTEKDKRMIELSTDKGESYNGKQAK